MDKDDGNPWRYDKLSALVDGRDVAVLCRKHVPAKHDPAAVTVRFNDDTVPSTIYVTAFWGPHNPGLELAASLIISSVPRARVHLPSMQMDKDFARDQQRFLQDETHEVELVDLDHWKLLQSNMPIFPLSGLVFLSMLSTTAFRTCEIQGMTFYQDQNDLGGSRRFHGMHDLWAASAWLEHLLMRDRRFIWRAPKRVRPTDGLRETADEALPYGFFALGGAQPETG